MNATARALIAEDTEDLSFLLARARDLRSGLRDEEAKDLYLAILRRDPGHVEALSEIALLAYASGFRSAARSAYEQLVRHDPHNVMAHTNLGVLLCEEGEHERSRREFCCALAIAPDFAQAHRGLARLFQDQGEAKMAEAHWRRGFEGQAVEVWPYRGQQMPVTVLMLVSVKGGNIPLRTILDDRIFAVTALYVEYYEPTFGLPPHAFVFNAIGDADLCSEALVLAQEILKETHAPVINHPKSVAATGRFANAERVRKIPGLRAPLMHRNFKQDAQAGKHFAFPFLMRAPGYHTGQHFFLVDQPTAISDAVAKLPGPEILEIEYFDARGLDGYWRKYRVMTIGGKLYPLHLAVSPNWKVHYFSAEMSKRPEHVAEEKHFLENMALVLGSPAMAALLEVAKVLCLDYAGIDFAMGPSGEILFFEANATMAVFQPPLDAVWNYRRAPIKSVIKAMQQLLLAQ